MAKQRALDKYPLPAEEARELIKATVLSEVLILGVTIIGLMVVNGVVTGDWVQSIFYGWALDIICALGPENSVGAIVPSVLDPSVSQAALQTGIGVPLLEASIHGPQFPGIAYYAFSLALGTCLAFVMLAVLVALDAVASFTRSHEDNLRKLRQGLMGELIRLPLNAIVPCMLLAGLAEELCFRFLLLNLVFAFTAMFLPWGISKLIALLVVTVGFWLIHTQYRDPFSSSVVIIGGFILGGAYLLTGWILVPMLAHALYNIGEILVERYNMVKEDDYFSGVVPENLVRKLNEKSKQAKDKDKEQESKDASNA